MDTIFGYIYKITNIVNNKIYIGKTTRLIDTRWKEHVQIAFSDSESQKQKQFYLQKAIKKYGAQNFTVEKICEAFSKEELNLKEQYYIAIYNSNNNIYGYNLTPGGDGGTPVEVCQLDLSGNFIQEFSSVAEATRATGGNCSGIVNCCLGVYNTSLGYQWCYKRDLDKRIKVPATKKRQTNIPIVQLSMQDDIIRVWDSIREAEKQLNISRGKISLVCKGKRKQTGNYKWRYLFDDANLLISKEHKASCQVNQYTKDGMFVCQFETINEAALSIGQKKGGHISDVCKHKRKYCGGYIWRYEGDDIL